jgi:hypothetical protein
MSWISKEDFSRIVSSKPSLSLNAYMTCPTCCAESYDKCVEQIKGQKCLRFDHLQSFLKINPIQEQKEGKTE